MDSRELFLLHGGWDKVDEDVQSCAGHDVDEEGCDFVQTVEDQAVAPHGDCYCVVAEGEAEGADEEAL